MYSIGRIHRKKLVRSTLDTILRSAVLRPLPKRVHLFLVQRNISKFRILPGLFSHRLPSKARAKHRYVPGTPYLLRCRYSGVLDSTRSTWYLKSQYCILLLYLPVGFLSVLLVHADPAEKLPGRTAAAGESR